MLDALEQLLDHLGGAIDARRQAEVERRHRRALAGEPVDRLPLVVACPLPPDARFKPLPYREAFTDPEKMLYNELVHAFDTSIALRDRLSDDLPLTVRANFGTVLIASMFGANVEQHGDNPPWVRHTPAGMPPSAVTNDAGPDRTRGLLPRVVETMEFYHATLRRWPELYEQVHVVLPDLQGPLDNLGLICGSRLLLDLAASPREVEAALAAVADAQIEVARRLAPNTTSFSLPDRGSDSVYFTLPDRGSDSVCFTLPEGGSDAVYFTLPEGGSDAVYFTLPEGGSDAVAAGEGYENPELIRNLPSPLVPRDPPGGRVKPKVSDIGLAPLVRDGPPGYSHQHGVMVRGNILLRVDSAVMISPEMYREQVAPHDERVLSSLGGGGVHCCGRLAHIADELLRLPSIACLDFGQPELNDVDAIYRAARARNVALTRVTPTEEELATGRIHERFPTGVNLVYRAGRFEDATRLAARHAVKPPLPEAP